MICDLCHGKGGVLANALPDRIITYRPCPRCGGTGVAHCCDGDQPSDRDKEEGDGRD